MDEMNIVSKFTTNMISKIVTKILKQKLGYNVEVKMNEIKISIDDGKAHIHLNVDAEIDNSELTRIVKDSMGID